MESSSPQLTQHFKIVWSNEILTQRSDNKIKNIKKKNELNELKIEEDTSKKQPGDMN
jgi:hypothetical protein